MTFLSCTLIAGLGATLSMDAWTALRARLFRIPPPDYGLVGRWLAHMRHGQFRHDSISAAPRVMGERMLGWTAHYSTGVAYAAALLVIWGEDWCRHPTLGPALIVGIGTVVAPFFLMQPGMGAGVAASRTPKPGAARLHSVLTHAAFGLGLYLAGWVTHLFYS